MKKFIIIALSLMIGSNLWAKEYITGLQKVTFRVGPGTGNKIISMLESNEGVRVIERGEEWSKVSNKKGKEGYVMTRFLTKEVPYNLRFKWLLGQHKKLKEELAQVKEQNSNLNKEFSNTKRELASTQENLESTANSFKELKDGSSEYLALKEKYDQAKLSLSSLNTRVEMLQEKLSLYYFTWFLTGAGILLLGWMIGYFSKKRKRGYGGGIQL
ncbi:MAG: hypothetical protein CME64_07350 [Halobacteriovoraceae bacterium]|nr:hypothetical protein [Halobacteriovoraceae bacterium]|tara:strand:- start:25367 stop:26008 length:642 start_codon:yes stop_codon:yes gene_type:complete